MLFENDGAPGYDECGTECDRLGGCRVEFGDKSLLLVVCVNDYDVHHHKMLRVEGHHFVSLKTYVLSSCGKAGWVWSNWFRLGSGAL